MLDEDLPVWVPCAKAKQIMELLGDKRCFDPGYVVYNGVRVARIAKEGS